MSAIFVTILFPIKLRLGRPSTSSVYKIFTLFFVMQVGVHSRPSPNPSPQLEFIPVQFLIPDQSYAQDSPHVVYPHHLINSGFLTGIQSTAEAQLQKFYGIVQLPSPANDEEPKSSDFSYYSNPQLEKHSLQYPIESESLLPPMPTLINSEKINLLGSNQDHLRIAAAKFHLQSGPPGNIESEIPIYKNAEPVQPDFEVHKSILVLPKISTNQHLKSPTISPNPQFPSIHFIEFKKAQQLDVQKVQEFLKSLTIDFKEPQYATQEDTGFHIPKYQPKVPETNSRDIKPPSEQRQAQIPRFDFQSYATKPSTKVESFGLMSSISLVPVNKASLPSSAQNQPKSLDKPSNKVSAIPAVSLQLPDAILPPPVPQEPKSILESKLPVQAPRPILQLPFVDKISRLVPQSPLSEQTSKSVPQSPLAEQTQKSTLEFSLPKQSPKSFLQSPLPEKVSISEHPINPADLKSFRMPEIEIKIPPVQAPQLILTPPEFQSKTKRLVGVIQSHTSSPQLKRELQLLAAEAKTLLKDTSPSSNLVTFRDNLTSLKSADSKLEIAPLITPSNLTNENTRGPSKFSATNPGASVALVLDDQSTVSLGNASRVRISDSTYFYIVRKVPVADAVQTNSTAPTISTTVLEPGPVVQANTGTISSLNILELENSEIMATTTAPTTSIPTSAAPQDFARTMTETTLPTQSDQNIEHPESFVTGSSNTTLVPHTSAIESKTSNKTVAANESISSTAPTILPEITSSANDSNKISPNAQMSDVRIVIRQHIQQVGPP